MDNLQELLALVPKTTKDLIYISDINTYELCYINESLIAAFNIKNADETIGKPCYEVLQGKTSPCEFCTNDRLTVGSVYSWRVQNPLTHENYKLQDSKIVHNGRDLRLEIATNIDDIVEKEKAIELQLKQEKIINECINVLYAQDDPNKAIDIILSICMNACAADRAYVFKQNIDKNSYSNTNETCSENVISYLDKMQNFSYEDLDVLINIVKEKNVFNVDDIKDAFDETSNLYKELSNQGIVSLIIVPMFDKSHEIIGFIGLDNPKIKASLLSICVAISNLISDCIVKINLMNEIHIRKRIDALTKVGNRQSFNEVLKELESQNIDSVGIVCSDLNGLKIINETKGTDYGDTILKNLANILKDILKGQVFRTGGDEFVTIVIGDNQEQFSNKVTLLKEKIDNTADIKVAIGDAWKRNSFNLPSFVEAVDSIRYVNKELYYQKTKPERKHNHMLAETIAKDIKNNCYEVYLQPQFDLKSNNLIGAEALIRKFDSDGKIIPPIDFIVFYEREGVVDIIDLFSFETVCKQLQKWRSIAETILGFKVSVNLSRISLLRFDIVEKLLELCLKYDIPPHMICVEVTETVNLDSEDIIYIMLSKLKEIGFGISLDDFGVGQSNFSIISEIEFSETKLDKSLVDKITTDTKSAILAKNLINLCKDLNINEIVAEGVETKEQLAILNQIGCNIVQGYYFDRPISCDDFEAKYMK